jgi:hypothetical protein
MARAPHPRRRFALKYAACGEIRLDLRRQRKWRWRCPARNYKPQPAQAHLRRVANGLHVEEGEEAVDVGAAHLLRHPQDDVGDAEDKKHDGGKSEFRLEELHLGAGGGQPCVWGGGGGTREDMEFEWRKMARVERMMTRMRQYVKMAAIHDAKRGTWGGRGGGRRGCGYVDCGPGHDLAEGGGVGDVAPAGRGGGLVAFEPCQTMGRSGRGCRWTWRLR